MPSCSPARTLLPQTPTAASGLAQQHCSPCHIVEPNQRQELADSPPFETIAQKYGNAPELIAFAILAPHPRMNVMLSRREAQDIAAYIATLAK
jgi:mono/diheme cytochrome c family protein